MPTTASTMPKAMQSGNRFKFPDKPGEYIFISIEY
jgi:hypothetical protein